MQGLLPVLPSGACWMLEEPSPRPAFQDRTDWGLCLFGASVGAAPGPRVSWDSSIHPASGGNGMREWKLLLEV